MIDPVISTRTRIVHSHRNRRDATHLCHRRTLGHADVGSRALSVDGDLVLATEAILLRLLGLLLPDCLFPLQLRLVKSLVRTRTESGD
jgi:hypothetical protein